MRQRAARERLGLVGAALAALALVAPSSSAAPGDTTADAVLGQIDFGGNVPNAPFGVAEDDNLALSNAAHLAVAPNGRLYVSDAENNRLLSWPSAASFANGEAADRVIGQPDFVSSAPNNGGVSRHSFFLPQGLWVDAAGDVWVTDAFNSRVLRFNNPDTDATPLDADLVIGQPDFVHNDQNLGQGGTGPGVALPDSLQFPGRVLVRWPDVYIADSGNSRVVHYTAPVANKPFADRVWGQFGDLTRRAKNNDGAGNNGCCPTADNLFNPIGIALDAAGRFYIADWNNHRILRFDDPLTSDTTADAVFGQPDFTSAGFDRGGPATGLQLPIDLAFDAAGRLLCADSGNNRILVYSTPLVSLLPDAVFGQLGSLTTDLENHGAGPLSPDPDGLFGPTGVAHDSAGNLFVVDTNNARVLRYDAPLPGGAGDVNCDGAVDGLDAAALALALVNPAAFGGAYPGCDIAAADVNSDRLRNGLDIRALLELL